MHVAFIVTQINKQTFYPASVGAVSNRTGVECLINSQVYHSRVRRKSRILTDGTEDYFRIGRCGFQPHRLWGNIKPLALLNRR